MPITSQDDSELHGTYDGHQIQIQKEDSGFYIIVDNRNGRGMMYDGYWGGNTDTFADAWAEALRGSCIKRKKANARAT